VLDVGPGDAVDPGSPREPAAEKLGELAIEARRKIIANLPELIVDDVEVVREPLRRGRDRFPLGDRRGDLPVAREQDTSVVLEPGQEPGAPALTRGDAVRSSELGGALVESSRDPGGRPGWARALRARPGRSPPPTRRGDGTDRGRRRSIRDVVAVAGRRACRIASSRSAFARDAPGGEWTALRGRGRRSRVPDGRPLTQQGVSLSRARRLPNPPRRGSGSP
jgi:hypothetical protein